MHASNLEDWLAQTSLLEGAPGDMLQQCAATVHTVELGPGDCLLRTGQRNDSLFLLLRGSIQVELAGTPWPAQTVALLSEGAVLGDIQVVTGQAATADVIAITMCTVLELPRDLLRTIGKCFPLFDERLTALATSRLHQLIFRRTVDSLLAAMEPELVNAFVGNATEVTIERGATLFQQGDLADAWYVLTSGRLSVSTGSDDEKHHVADLKPGASVGEMALITGAPRSATVSAERKSTLMRLSKSDFEIFAETHTSFARRLMGIVVQRMSGMSEQGSSLHHNKSHNGARQGSRVFILLRASGSPLLVSALQQLCSALHHAMGAVLCTRLDFEKSLGRTLDPVANLAETHPVWSRFDVWLQEAQDKHAVVLLDAGYADDLWRRECLLQGDQCLWLAEPTPADAQRAPQDQVDRLQGALQWAQRDSRPMACALLLAHPAGTDRPRNTCVWLAGGCFDRHFHMRLDDPASMARTARLLTGRGIGLALSGGGARGLAHIGVFQAFLEAGVPIDCIGGTSMGAIQAAMFAMGLSVDEMERLNLQVMAKKPFQEYTLPVIALVASRRRDACIELSFSDVQIEDLWIPYIAVSTDLHGARAYVHAHGSLGLAAKASSSLPGVLVPVIDGPRILVDGGIINNLPADLVKARFGGTVFGCNVAPSDDLPAPAGGFPSPWALLLHRVIPWHKSVPIPRIPRLGDILIRTMTVGSSSHMQRIRGDMDVLIEPDVEGFSMLQFKAIKPLIQRGHVAAKRCLDAWVARNSQ